jgi:hypothetical protein
VGRERPLYRAEAVSVEEKKRERSTYCAFQKFVESLARPSNYCAAPPNCDVETDSTRIYIDCVECASFCS